MALLHHALQGASKEERHEELQRNDSTLTQTRVQTDALLTPPQCSSLIQGAPHPLTDAAHHPRCRPRPVRSTPLRDALHPCHSDCWSADSKICKAASAGALTSNEKHQACLSFLL
mmetsp:Transcript_6760/g.18130  ORF Transcript_6760/g.18130 Transcript_6760/m.18130 type:complete len:115 (+) Transcript_6760:666-1010(+)